MISLDRQAPGAIKHAIDQLDAFRRDLLAIKAGHQPPGLSHAVVLDHVVLSKRVVPCLIGDTVTNVANDGPIKTGELLVAHWDRGWVRTADGFFRISSALDLKTR